MDLKNQTQKRIIKFRGKNLKGQWHYGLLCHDKTKDSDYEWFISNSAGKPYAFGAIPETIGQFTGLQDKNGVEIYEGDKVKVINKPYNVKNSVVVWGKKSNGWSLKCEVIKENSYDPEIKYYGLESGKSLEVVGSIHTTPEIFNPLNK